MTIFFIFRLSVVNAIGGVVAKTAREESSEKTAERSRRYRMNPKNRGAVIVRDARKSDVRNGFQNDLDAHFVQDLVIHGCTYCGASFEETTITLDRIDNSRGHLKDNVVPACLNCNLTRGTMPYPAWLIISATIREVRKLGLLKGWNKRKY